MAPSKELVAAPSKAVVKDDLNIDQTLKASKALLAHIKKAAKTQSEESGKRNLLQDDDDDVETPIWLTLNTKRHIVDKARLQPGKITLPHPLSTDESTTICLITADPQRAYKNIVAHEDFPAALGKRITRVIDVTHLQAKFSRYEAQRKLFSEHDLFLGDERIINRLPKVLGKTFYKTTQKRPVPVVLAPKPSKADKKAKKQPKAEGEVNAKKPADVAKEVTKAIGSALVSLAPSTNTAIKIGWSNWEPQQIADNAAAVVEALVEKWVPRKWRNVQGIYIKGPETAALPIWLTDELWLEDKDVVEDVAEADSTGGEKANVGKKRKTIAAEEEGEAAVEESPAPKKKSKKQKEEQLPEGDDAKLDKQISERKTRLRTQKAKAKKSMDE